jgi:hypothetical protein
MKWKQWMIENGFGMYVSKAVDLKKPSYPFVLKEGLSENSEGVNIIQDVGQLEFKLRYFKHNNITDYYGEEPLTGMNNSQGIFYVSAFGGKVLTIQCYVYLILKDDIEKQKYNNSLFIAGRPKHSPHVRGHIYRVKNDQVIAEVLRKITKKSLYTGVYCAEFKMNSLQQIVFMEFNARICYISTQKDTYFIEAYLPLVFSLHRYIRNIKPQTLRIVKIKKESNIWYQNKTMQSKARGFHLHSNTSIESSPFRPTISQLLMDAIYYR